MYIKYILAQSIAVLSEFGHNWGSQHDPDTTECAPSTSSGGKYLMYTYSVTGYDSNNQVDMMNIFVLLVCLLSCKKK